MGELLDESQLPPPRGEIHEMDPGYALIQTALDKGVDPDVLSKLVDMRMNIMADNARREFADAMVRWQKICPIVPKGDRVYFKARRAGAEDTDYNFAGLPRIMEAIREPLDECGLSVTWKDAPEATAERVGVTCRVMHRSGHYEESTRYAPPDNSGNKNSVQAVQSTVTYLRRYTMSELLGIATGDNDGAGDPTPQETISEDDACNLLDEAADYQVQDKFEAWLITKFGTKVLTEIAIERYAEINGNLQKAIKARAGQ